MDTEFVELLRQSRFQFKGVYPVIMDTDGEVLAGNHRLKAGWERRHTIDTAALAAEKKIPRIVMKEIVRVHLNIQRRVAPEELALSMNAAASAFVASGLQKGKLVDELCKCFPYSRQYIRELLRPEFKDEAKSEAGRKGAEKKQEMSPASQEEQGSARTDAGRNELLEEKVARKAPFSKGVSPRASEHRKPAYTGRAMLLASILESAHIPIKVKQPFERVEVNSQGEPLTYVADIVAYDHVVCEAEGDGSSSRDNEERDRFFKSKGLIVLHLPNSVVDSGNADILVDYVNLVHFARQPEQEHTIVVDWDKQQIIYNGGILSGGSFRISGPAKIFVKRVGGDVLG